MQAQTKSFNRVKTNVLIDLAIFGAFLFSTAPHFTGMTIHEWLGISFAAGILTHLLLHWQWVVGTTKKFFSRIPRQLRINYALNTLLFVDITIIIFTGLMISESALPLFGIQFARNQFWTWLHRVTADASVYLIGMHVALHWRWIWSQIQRWLVVPIFSRRPAPQLTLQPIRVRKES